MATGRKLFRTKKREDFNAKIQKIVQYAYYVALLNSA